MYKNKQKLIFLLTILLLLFIAVNSAYATSMNVSDSNDTSQILGESNYQGTNNLDSNNISQLSEKINNNNSSANYNTFSASNENNTFYISPNGTGTGLSSNDPGNWTIINNIHDTSTVYMLNGTYTVYNQSITKDLTLSSYNGDNVIIDGQQKGYIFEITNSTTLTLNGLTLTNGIGKNLTIEGYNVTVGGAIVSYGNLNFFNTSFINNKADVGGAIFTQNASISGSKSIFKDNLATINGGAIDLIYSNININSSIFVNNTDSNGKNSIVGYENNYTIDYNWWGTNDPRSKTIKEHSLENLANNWIIMDLSLNNSTLTATLNKVENTTNDISPLPSSMMLPSVNVTFNSLSSTINPTSNITDSNDVSTTTYTLTNRLDIINATIYDYTYTIINKNYTNIIVNGSYTGNYSDGTLNYPFKNITSAVTIANLLDYPVTILLCDGVYNDVNMTVTNNVTFQAINQGKVTIDAKGKGYIFNCLDTTKTISIIGLKLINGTGYNLTENTYGGAIYTEGYLILENSSLQYNHANYGGVIDSFQDCNITNCDFSNNYATTVAGAINGGILNIKNSNFTNNTAESQSAVYGTKITMNGCNFINNSATNGSGCVYAFGLTYISNTSFINNTATLYTGAITTMGGNITNCIFTNNLGGNASCIWIRTYFYYSLNMNIGPNWYGNNTPFDGANYNKLIYNQSSKNYTSAPNWVLMTLNTTNINLKMDEWVNVTVGFTEYTDGVNNYTLNTSLPYYTINYMFNDKNSTNGTVKVFNNSRNINLYGTSPTNKTMTFTIDNQSLTLNLNVTGIDNNSTIIKINKMDYYYGEEHNLTGTLTDSYKNLVINQIVSLNLTNPINGLWKIYNVTTNRDGVFSLPITLVPGNYGIKAYYEGNEYLNASSLSTGITIYTGILNTQNLTGTFGDKLIFKGNYTTINGTPLKNKTVTIYLYRFTTRAIKQYNLTTDANGNFQLPITLSCGNYLIDTTIPTEGNENINFININNGTIDNRTITAFSLVEYDNLIYGALETINGKDISNTSVTLELTRLSSKASKNYTVTTDEDGIFRLNLNLAKGDYYLHAFYNGTSIYQPCEFKYKFTI